PGRASAPWADRHAGALCPVVGLGTRGRTSASHRRNAGHRVLAELAARAGVTSARPRSGGARAEIAEARLGTLPGGAPGPRVVLAKPVTYMNVSGGPVAGVARDYAIEPENVVVVHDELDLPFGQVRRKKGGGEGGHNGLRAVSKSLGTRDYVRVRVGIGRPPGRMDPADFVLRYFSSVERKELPFLVPDAADAAEAVVLTGLEAAQLRFHSPR